MQGVISMRLNGNTGMALKILVILAVVFALMGMMAFFFGCASTGSGQADREKVEEVIGHVQRIEQAIVWIAPIACTAIAVAAPEAIPACHMAVASANALKVVTDQAVAAYRADPTAANADAITDVLGKLKQAWDNLDAAYKGDAQKVQSAVQPQARIHPFRWKRKPVSAFQPLPSLWSLQSLSSLQSLRT